MIKDLIKASDKNVLQSQGSVPVVAKGVVRSLESGDSVLRPSQHNAHELTYVRSGKMKYLLNGREYKLKAGELFVLKPGIDHSFTVTEGPVDLVVVYFAFSKQASGDRSVSPYDNVSSVSIDQFMQFNGTTADEKVQEPGFFLTGKGKVEVARAAEAVVAESEGDGYAKDLMMQALAMILVVEVARTLKAAWEETLRVKQGKARELVLIARDFIEEHFAEDISVADAAGYVFLSQGYFARAFRDELNMSPMAYLIHIRVEKACDLLKRPDLKVSAIASRVGFSSPQRFNAAFRKQMGMTPMEYRRRIAVKA